MIELRPELSRYVELILEDEGWQTGETGELRIKREFATRLLSYADNNDLDLEAMYRKVLAGLKAMKDDSQETHS